MNKIFMLDDEEPIRILYTEELVEDGFDVVTRADGSRLLERIEQEKPDLIVMDIKLGEYDGLDLLQDIRNTYYDLPVILFSKYPEYRHDPRAIAADYYVIKSRNPEDLKLKIKVALEARISWAGA